ncbi:MAG TPA: PLP-dependent aminotransferase family protein [Clostridia bacterium]|nr:PLP-dependent aminotransferase family protein [Clostridia bacterium]
MFVELDRNSAIPVKKQLYDAITSKILRGELAEGEKLPSTRELADRLNIARNSVIEIYEQLVSEAYLETIGGRGTFVCGGRGGLAGNGVQQERKRPERAIKKGIIDFGCGVPDLGTFPRRAWLRALKESLDSTEDSELGYASALGYRPLRRSLAQYLMKYKGISCSYEQVVIVNGTSDAIVLLALLFRYTIARIIIESAVVSFVPDIFREFGYGIVPVKIDRYGVCTGDLPDMENGLIFTSPSHQFPLGGTLSAERRRKLADYAKVRGHYIVEDDYDSEFRYAGAPVNSLFQLAPENVIHLGTFSKTLAPFLRLGYIVLPKQLVPRVKKLQSLLYRRVGTHAQMALNCLLENGIYAKHVNTVCKLYKRKMLTITDALRREFGDTVEALGVNSGLHIAVVFPNSIFDSKSRKVFLHNEVDVELLSDYTIEKQENCDTLILGFGHLSEAAISDGIRRLKAAADELSQVQK